MTFSVLGATGYGYGLVIGVSYLVYLCATGLVGYRERLPAGTVRLFGLFGLPLGLVLARAAYCAVDFSYFTDTVSQPWKMLAFWDGGFSLIGALCGLVLAALLASRLSGARFGRVLDVVAIPLGLLLIGVRLAEGLTGAPGDLVRLGFGRQVNVGALAQTFPVLFLTDQQGTLTLTRLAVFRYEALAGLLLLVAALALYRNRRPRQKNRPGDLAMIVFSLFGAGQVLLESLRDDGHMIWGFIRAQQLACVLMPLLALVIFGARYAHIRQARKTAVAAWLLLPVAALVALLMIHPLNHVLDLTKKPVIGFAVLGGIGLYLAFFLRVRGANMRLVLTWLIAIVAVAGCVMVEFSVDGSDNLLRDYALMAVCCTALFMAPFSLWRRLKGSVYREESLTVRIPDA